jgi:hypothetical protein
MMVLDVLGNIATRLESQKIVKVGIKNLQVCIWLELDSARPNFVGIEGSRLCTSRQQGHGEVTR